MNSQCACICMHVSVFVCFWREGGRKEVVSCQFGWVQVSTHEWKSGCGVVKGWGRCLPVPMPLPLWSSSLWPSSSAGSVLHHSWWSHWPNSQHPLLQDWKSTVTSKNKWYKQENRQGWSDEGRKREYLFILPFDVCLVSPFCDFRKFCQKDLFFFLLSHFPVWEERRKPWMLCFAQRANGFT